MNQSPSVGPADVATETKRSPTTTGVRTLLAEVLAAHGGIDRWRRFTQVTSTVVTGGFLWSMKGMEIDASARRMTSDFRRQRTRTEPFGDAEWQMTYEPDSVVIATQSGTIIAEQQHPRETFAGHVWETPWSPLQLGYFNGYAMWTYYNLPFLLGEAGVETTEIAPIDLEGRALRGLRARFAPGIHTHCREQNLYFDGEGLLRRHDYQVDVAGGTRAAHLISDYVDVQGLRFPTRRRVFVRNEDGTFQSDRTLVSADLSDVQLS
jgi:hypothetical protein